MTVDVTKTPVQQAQSILREHTKDYLKSGEHTGDFICRVCKQRWPCDARVMAGHIIAVATIAQEAEDDRKAQHAGAEHPGTGTPSS